MMKTLYTVLGILLSFLILWIFSLNVGQTVDIDLAFHSYKAVNLITITYLSFFSGFILGLLILAIKFIGFKKEKFQLKKEIKTLKKEISEFHSIQPVPELPEEISETAQKKPDAGISTDD